MKLTARWFLALGITAISGCASESVIFSVTPYLSDTQTIAQPYQIYRMASDGTGRTNLSNNSFFEYMPDVHHKTKKIVFRSNRSGGAGQLHVMDIDGSNATVVPNTSDADYPRWSRGEGGNFILFHAPSFGDPNPSRIHRINPDGTGRQQIMSPAATLADWGADSIDDKHIVFVRVDRAAGYRSDLYLKYIEDNRPEVRLTNTPNESEQVPVVSHDGKRVAYSVQGFTVPESIHIARFNPGLAGITVEHTIPLVSPLQRNVVGLDFSSDDQRLYVSVQATDVVSPVTNRRIEIFSMNLDGSDIRRLTTNMDADLSPSAVPK